jgi:hypothetical protein
MKNDITKIHNALNACHDILEMRTTDVSLLDAYRAANKVMSAARALREVLTILDVRTKFPPID